MIRFATLLLVLAAQAAPPTGSISGNVADASTRAPIPFAHVVLARVDGPLTQSIAGRADDQGRFSITGITPGRYRVFAEDPDYLRHEHSTAVVVTSGQAVAGVSIALTRTGVIAGRVLTERGHPAPSIYVRAWQGNRLVAETRTNDLGEYRLFGLSPGSFVVGAERYQGPRIGKFSPIGRPLDNDVYTVPTPPCPDCRGEGAGWVNLANLLKTGAFIDPRALNSRTYPQVFYPSSTERSQATPIEIQPGAEVAGIDMRLVER